ncbi:MAG: hypothetical protein GF418_04100 [Chitinivibrionales bacterium]|nr:hypothetical protein [Chitinivibrionales bacterium]MBD3394789.1 hypothetical protein [Chitinivibrionales bacterium]
MKARLVPLYFNPGRDADFDTQLDRLKEFFKGEAEFLDPVELGKKVPEAEAVIFPQFLGQAFSQYKKIEAVALPKLVITSQFGTVNMWDWELVNFLKMRGIPTICPSSFEQSKTILRGLRARRRLASSRFVVFQDKPGSAESKQGDIFRRFYWLEDESYEKLTAKYGMKIEKRSFAELGKQAAAISDAEAEKVIGARPVKKKCLTGKPLMSATKVYMAVKKVYEEDPEHTVAMGINCLNESYHSDSTPCLCWNLLWDDYNLVWGCEGDTMTMMTEYIVTKALEIPFFMTNLYPFLMGKAALSHERIPHFPKVDEPENHLLLAHCGYFGLLPEAFSTEWALKKRVLAMVDPNAVVIDAKMETGKITFAKLQPYLERLSLSEGELTGYIQYEDSDCLNGGIARVKDGRGFVQSVASHHYIVMPGHQMSNFKLLEDVFGYTVEEI